MHASFVWKLTWPRNDPSRSQVRPTEGRTWGTQHLYLAFVLAMSPLAREIQQAQIIIQHSHRDPPASRRILHQAPRPLKGVPRPGFPRANEVYGGNSALVRRFKIQVIAELPYVSINRIRKDAVALRQ